ncbi:S-adenosylmethionine decarboxylase [Patescibacteria group bacterium]|nr:S-adenosylmethionine decarboxylase [Patescibacteria group bacterium]
MDIAEYRREFRACLNNPFDCLRFLMCLVVCLGTKPVAFHFQLYPTPDNCGGNGVTATVYFVESYATIDCWAEEKYVHLNIVSCKEFDIAKVEALIAKEEKVQAEFEFE